MFNTLSVIALSLFVVEVVLAVLVIWVTQGVVSMILTFAMCGIFLLTFGMTPVLIIKIPTILNTSRTRKRTATCTVPELAEALNDKHTGDVSRPGTSKIWRKKMNNGNQNEASAQFSHLSVGMISIHLRLLNAGILFDLHFLKFDFSLFLLPFNGGIDSRSHG